jgi:hypothetical protein
MIGTYRCGALISLEAAGSNKGVSDEPARHQLRCQRDTDSAGIGG